MIPGLAKEMPKISDGGKTYTLFLRPGLKYSDGTAVKASDFTYAVERALQGQLRRLALLHRHRRRRKVRGNEDRRHPRHRSERQDRRDRHPPGQTARHVHQRARTDVRGTGPPGHAGHQPVDQPAPRDRPVHDHQSRPEQRLGLRTQPLLGQGQREGDAGIPERAHGQDQRLDHPQPLDPGQRRRAGQVRLDADAATAGSLRRDPQQIRRHPVPGRADDQHLLLLDERQQAAVRRRQGAPGGQLRGRPGGAGTDLHRLAQRQPADPAAGDARLRETRISTRTTWPKPRR